MPGSDRCCLLLLLEAAAAGSVNLAARRVAAQGTGTHLCSAQELKGTPAWTPGATAQRTTSRWSLSRLLSSRRRSQRQQQQQQQQQGRAQFHELCPMSMAEREPSTSSPQAAVRTSGSQLQQGSPGAQFLSRVCSRVSQLQSAAPAPQPTFSARASQQQRQRPQQQPRTLQAVQQDMQRVQARIAAVQTANEQVRCELCCLLHGAAGSYTYTLELAAAEDRQRCARQSRSEHLQARWHPASRCRAAIHAELRWHHVLELVTCLCKFFRLRMLPLLWFSSCQIAMAAKATSIERAGWQQGSCCRAGTRLQWRLLEKLLQVAAAVVVLAAAGEGERVGAGLEAAAGVRGRPQR